MPFVIYKISILLLCTFDREMISPPNIKECWELTALFIIYNTVSEIFTLCSNRQ